MPLCCALTPQGLAGVNSYTMIDVGPGAGASAGGALIGGDGGGAPGQGPQSGGPQGQGQAQGMPAGLDHERRLSLKLNSMSLDLDKVIAEHTGS